MLVNAEPANVRAKHGVSRVNNIFDEYAGIAPDQRAFFAPEGIKAFKKHRIYKGRWYTSASPKAYSSGEGSAAIESYKN